MKHPNRSAERRREVIEVLQQRGYGRVYDMSGEEKNGRYFEGTGEEVWGVGEEMWVWRGAWSGATDGCMTWAVRRRIGDALRGEGRLLLLHSSAYGSPANPHPCLCT